MLRHLALLLAVLVAATACGNSVSGRLFSRASTPRAVPMGVAAATTNPLYETGRLPAVVCHPPPISTQTVQGYLDGVAGCLDAAWSGQFAKARLPFKPPARQYVKKRQGTGCGRIPARAVAMYCPRNTTMYVLVGGEEGSALRTGSLGAFVMGHEYGHHLQNAAGILDYAAPGELNKSTGAAVTRRVELQADCLSGAFLNSVRASLPVRKNDWYGTVSQIVESGDDTVEGPNDHGTGENMIRWANRGFTEGTPGACNTWTAPDDEVS